MNFQPETGKYSCDSYDQFAYEEYVRGISTGKEFIDTKANLDGVSLNSYKIVKHNDFAYVSDTSRRGDKIAIAYNNNNQNLLISSIYLLIFLNKLF